MEEVNIIVTEAVEEVNITATEVVEDVTIVVSEAIAGLDAYQVYVVNTTDVPPMTLEEWQASLIGDKGDKGDKGDDGYTPIKGVDYFDGAKGDQGEKGNTGDKGDKGDTGAGLPIGGSTGQIPAKIDETNFNIQWIDPPQGGGSGKQNKFDVLQTAHGLLVGNVVRSGGANSFAKAKADSADNAEVIGIVTEVADEDNFTVVTGGIIETGVPAANFGTVFFLDPDVAGGITTVDPMDTGVDGTVSKPLLTVLKSGEIALFQNFRGIVIGSVGQNSGGGGGLTISEGTAPVNARYAGAFYLDSLTGSTIPSVNDTVTIDGVTYTWKAVKVLATDILLGADDVECYYNLHDVFVNHSTVRYNASGNCFVNREIGSVGNGLPISATGNWVLRGLNNIETTETVGGVDGTIGTPQTGIFTDNLIGFSTGDGSSVEKLLYICPSGNTITGQNWCAIPVTSHIYGGAYFEYY
jgi:hypothetical protein